MSRPIAYHLNIHLTEQEEKELQVVSDALHMPYSKTVRVLLTQAYLDIIRRDRRPPGREEDGDRNPRLVITGVISEKGSGVL